MRPLRKSAGGAALLVAAALAHGEARAPAAIASASPPGGCVPAPRPLSCAPSVHDGLAAARAVLAPALAARERR